MKKMKTDMKKMSLLKIQTNILNGTVNKTNMKKMKKI